MDDRDYKLISLLIANPKSTLAELSNKLGISLTAVSKRIKKLEHEEIIQNNICINVEKFKMAHMTILVETTDVKSRSALIKNFSNCPLVYQIFELTGFDYHLMILLLSEDSTLLHNFVTYCPINFFEGVKRIKTLKTSIDTTKNVFLAISSEKAEVVPECALSCSTSCLKYKKGCPGCPAQEYMEEENVEQFQSKIII